MINFSPELYNEVYESVSLTIIKDLGTIIH